MPRFVFARRPAVFLAGALAFLQAAGPALPVFAQRPAVRPTLTVGESLGGELERAGSGGRGLPAVLDRFWTGSRMGGAAAVTAGVPGPASQSFSFHSAPAPQYEVPPVPAGGAIRTPETERSLFQWMKSKVADGAAEVYAGGFRLINKVVPWHKMPTTTLKVLNLVALRHDLRKYNLHGTGHLDAGYNCGPSAIPERFRENRSPDGRYNDLNCPDMGRAGAPFGSNTPLDQVHPEVLPGKPDPAEISKRLMTRKKFQPATIINNIAMAWLQFEVHDWVQTGRSPQRPVPGSGRPGAPALDGTERVPDERRTDGGGGPPVFPNKGTHWWDGSQVYGSSEEAQAKLRTGSGGLMRVEENGLLPLDPAYVDAAGKPGIDMTGRNDNYWMGLSLMHTLFTLEHNAIARRLKQEYPDMDDQKLFDKARLVNAALIAKIHTVEWTPAILPNPALKVGMTSNWWGLSGALFGKDSWVRRALPQSEMLTGIPGSKTDHHGADYSLTSSFDIVYHMHPLVPDSYEMRDASSGEHLATMGFNDLQGLKTREAAEKIGMGNILYSFGISHPGAVRLNNFPEGLQNFEHFSGRRGDLAAADILRTRERGVPRYNDFRELLRMPRVKSFEELTGGDKEMAKEVSDVYGGDIDKVDTIVGMFAEPLPEGFGFSDTAFRIFILMASRRLKSDRFLSSDYRPEIYTQAGFDWVENTTMKDVLLRHYPELAPALKGIDNAFKGSWNKIGEPKAGA